MALVYEFHTVILELLFLYIGDKSFVLNVFLITTCDVLETARIEAFFTPVIIPELYELFMILLSFNV